MQIFISSSVYKKDLGKVVSLANEFDCGIEISRFGFFKTEEEKEIVFEDARNTLIGFDKPLSVHAYFYDLDVGSRDPEIERLSQERHFQSLEFAKYINAKTVVFHTGFNNFKHHDYQKQFLRKYIDFWKKFIGNFEDSGIIAVLENVLENDPQRNLGIIKEIGSPNLKLCVDTGHVNVYSDVDVCTWLEVCKDFLYHMHIHNNFGDDDSHNSIVKGALEFEKIFDKLKQLQVNPQIVFEIFDESALRESLKFFNEYFS